MGRPNKTRSRKNEKCLENAEVFLSRIYQKTAIQNTVLSWRIRDYEKLRCDVIYLQIYETIDIKVVLRLFKKADSLFVCVSGSTLPKRTAAEFFILDEVNMVTANSTSTAEALAEGVFAAHFKNESFLGPDFRFLRLGVLTISFKYASGRCVEYNEKNTNDPEVIEDLDDLCYDFKNMYLEALYPDFLIHVQDYSFKTHKFILAARSKYFESLFKNNKTVKEYTLDNIPGIAHQVFLYMYSSELQEMDLNCMLKVYELAFFLDVSTLRIRCLEYFQQQINQANYEVIVESCKRTASAELKNIVIYFLQDKMQSVNIVDIFK